MVEESAARQALADADRASLKQRLLQVVGFLVFAAIVVWAAHHLDRHELWHDIRSSDGGFLAAAALVNLGVIALQGWRWRILLEPIGVARYRDVVGALIMCFVTSSIVPARAGELVRVHVMARQMGVRRAAVAGTTVLDHVVNGISIVPLLVILPLLGPLPTWIQRGVLIVLAVVTAGVIVAWFSADPSAPATGHFISRMRRGLMGVRSPRRMAQAAGVAALAWLGEVLVLWLCLRAFTPQFGLAVGVITLVAVNVAIAIPSPPGNFGTLEVGAVLVLVAFGMERERAVAFAVAYHVVQLVSVWVVSPVGWWWSRQPPPDRLPGEADHIRRGEPVA